MRLKFRRLCFCLIIFLTLMLLNMTALLGVILRFTADLELTHSEMMSSAAGIRLKSPPDSPINIGGSNSHKNGPHLGTYSDAPGKVPAKSVRVGAFPDTLEGRRLDQRKFSVNTNDTRNKTLNTTRITFRMTNKSTTPDVAYKQYMVNASTTAAVAYKQYLVNASTTPDVAYKQYMVNASTTPDAAYKQYTVNASTTPAVAYKQYMVNLTDSSYYDRYLKTVMESKSSCQNVSSYDAVVAVHTAPGNVDKRQAFRWLYLDTNKTFPYKIKVFFFIGQVANLKGQNQLVNESQQFGDLVQGSFLDSYKNLTYKAIFTYKWLNDHCQGLRLLLRLDDDVFLSIQRFFEVWTSMIREKSNTILCDVKLNDPVTRKGKWLVKKSEVAEDVYHFRHCLGYFSAMTPDIVHKLYENGRRTKFFWIDDVFMFGFAANKAGVNFVGSNRENARTKYEDFRSCFEKLGKKCKYMSTITKVENFRSFHSLINNHTNIHLI